MHSTAESLPFVNAKLSREILEIKLHQIKVQQPFIGFVFHTFQGCVKPDYQPTLKLSEFKKKAYISKAFNIQVFFKPVHLV